MNPLRVGITGQDGFVGYHFRNFIARQASAECIHFERGFFGNPDAMDKFVNGCDAIVHLAGVNRGTPVELYEENLRLARLLEESLRRKKGPTRLVFASSTQETLDNPYGKAKSEIRENFEKWARETGSSLTTFILPNLFGAFGRPFYNSVTATFSHQLVNGETPQVLEDRELNLLHVERVSAAFYAALSGKEARELVELPADRNIRVSELLGLLREQYSDYVDLGLIPRLNDAFEIDLFNTLRSYLPNSFFPRHPKIHTDPRGSLFEAVRALGKGQTFVSTSHPGIVRGNHYHTRKIERFCVLSGSARIRWRKWGVGQVSEFLLAGGEAAVVDIPVLHTHTIENTGDSELVTLFWTNELYDPNDPDTYSEKVTNESTG